MGKHGRCLPVLLMVLATTGCGTIKSLFPDKERDYQFRTEIPELVVPEDLKAKTLPERTPEEVAAAAVATASPAEGQQSPVPDNQAQPAAADQPAPADAQKSAGSIVPSNPAVSSLQIDQSRNQAWRLVARALSRQRTEIVERNIDKGYFYVKYDPHASKPDDGSIWDEVTFLFGDDPSHEQEYRISLLEIAPQVTEVTVQNEDGKTLSNDVATALLKLITDGINSDLPQSAPDETNDSVPVP